MRSLKVIKIGGNVIDNPEKLQSFLSDFAAIEGPKILIHGGGKIATKLSTELGIEAKLIDGRRITDEDTLRVVTMVYGGLINKNIVASLQKYQCNAIGLTGADANIICAKKRPVKKIFSKEMNQAIDLDYGFVGDLDKSSVDAASLCKLLESGFTPVFSAITHDGKGQLLNTNADTIASILAASLVKQYETSLIYCFEKSGVLMDVNDESSLIESINPSVYSDLKKNGIINEGMIPKLDNAFEAIENGVKEVFIGKSDALTGLNQNNFGTRLTM
ncbi:acetylglutamate kinase [Daejeonella sp.]|jgi:acetylglutamate kinase|uniref:acetylglutamate kinase n=1 Tax=Daejeonella sp. TaxID=2805397 RepID=UPI003784D856